MEERKGCLQMEERYKDFIPLREERSRLEEDIWTLGEEEEEEKDR